MSVQQPEGRKQSWFITLFVKSVASVPDLRTDVPPTDGSTPRLNVINHIQAQIKDCDGPTVGEGIVSAIRTLREAAGERGARQIDTVFVNPEMTKFYRRPLSDLKAHEEVAKREVAYWVAEHQKNPTGGTRTAVAFDVEDRVKLQHGFGMLNEFSKSVADPTSDFRIRQVD
ncbi:hypothetical protein ACIBLA_17450 [Streptomyces sp. NPDC050433]|uniref:hypothetical protein n=1 Tax=unclassified Streptomyces TaxID=2593676 RepID=UPI00344459D5